MSKTNFTTEKLYEDNKGGVIITIEICDAIMGSGKSSAAINYMNEHPKQKFIYITPYLEEVTRIKNSCPDLHFKEPSNKLPEFDFRKYVHTIALIEAGENITSTHNMFLRYSDDMVDLIRKHKYTLIIDEAVDVLRPSNLTSSDMQLLEKAGWITNEDGLIRVSPTFDYQSGFANEIVTLSKGNRLINMPDTGGGGTYYYWLFSKDILEAFENVKILTYLFDAQTMKYYFDIVNIDYKYIGVCKDGDYYYFTNEPKYIPEYTASLSKKIHIFKNDKMNDIGNNKHALSYTWFKRTSDSNNAKKETLRKNVYNFFINYNRERPSKSRLWATYKSGESLLRGKGYFYSDIAFNAKATNNYRDKYVLAYLVNIFMQPNEKNYLLSNGVDVLEDKYALSIMLQWIWRSAIRDGKEIWVYIPSKRMRSLLEDWITDTEQLYNKINQSKEA